MQDACDASYNAVKSMFPRIHVLMCYFHVKMNVRKHKNLIDSDKYDELQSDLKDIHMSCNEEEYIANCESFKEKYSTKHKEMYDYCSTWLSGRFCNWQIYHNKPGHANTNSNIESFNNCLKRDFTDRKKMTMRSAMVKLKEVVLYYSTNKLEFLTQPKFCPKVKERSLTIIKNNFSKEKGSIYYTNADGYRYKIVLNSNKYHNKYSCECPFFLKYAVCKHLVAYSNLNNLKLFDEKYSITINEKPIQKTFLSKNKKGPKKGGRNKKAGSWGEKE